MIKTRFIQDNLIKNEDTYKLNYDGFIFIKIGRALALS